MKSSILRRLHIYRHLEFVTQQIQMEDGDASDVRVGLMTYDSRIHLYDLSPELSRPHMLVITETEDLQLPVREGLLVPLKDCIIPMELPVKGLGCPGKLCKHLWSIFQPSEQAVSVVKECVRQGCGVHLFVLSHQGVGGAWPGDIPYLTGGALHTYSHLQGELDRERFSTDLKGTVETHTGYKAELRIFVSKGEIYFLVKILQGVLCRNASITCTRLTRFTRVRLLRAVVLSYTLQTGDRRTRVHTLTLRCSQQLQDTFRHYQAQTLLTFYCKKMYCAVQERPLQELREELQTEVTEALASYRKHCCSASVSAGQVRTLRPCTSMPLFMVLLCCT
uniref:Uncharacterized protein n=1 Tax=Oreochromis aureus TaxID=47969 RepID=A0A668S7P9_OREAU